MQEYSLSSVQRGTFAAKQLTSMKKLHINAHATAKVASQLLGHGAGSCRPLPKEGDEGRLTRHFRLHEGNGLQHTQPHGDV
eukprot:1156255-Pelagomonas_calceolata.AAC.6